METINARSDVDQQQVTTLRDHLTERQESVSQEITLLARLVTTTAQTCCFATRNYHELLKEPQTHATKLDDLISRYCHRH